MRVNFENPTPNPYTALMGVLSPILQKAQFENCMGAKAPECTDANFGPIGTGPFVVTDFRPNDVATFKANENYRDANKPAFAEVVLKGGGDAASAGRAVMETGEFDYAWNLQLAPDVIANMAKSGKGTPISAFGTLVERIELNMTNPSSDLPEGERSTAAHPHPFLSDINVRKALSMAIDRDLLVEIGYGQAGRPVILCPRPRCTPPATPAVSVKISTAPTRYWTTPVGCVAPMVFVPKTACVCRCCIKPRPMQCVKISKR